MPRGASPRPARRPRHAAPVPAPPRAPRRAAPQRFWLLATTALLPVAAGQALAQSMLAPSTGPAGGQVVAGQAAIAQGANRTTITQGTDRAAIDWQQFNVGSQHTVQFVQPNQGSWTLNRVVGPDPSVIAGRVQANGGVAIVNQSGMVFARGAQVDVGALIASAAGITNENFMAGRMAFDQAPRPGARVENHGTITVADRGLAALVGPGVANAGVIRARLGRVALGAAETFVLDLAGDGLIGIDVTQAVRTAPEGGTALVTNSGVIEAAGGSVLLTAHAASGLVEDLVRHTGRIDAPTVGERTGQVAIRAEGGGTRVDGTITATGGADARGGSIAVQATGAAAVGAAARIDASGGTGGGRVLVGTTGRGRNQRMAARTTVEAGAEIRADATTRGTGGEILVNSAERTEMRGTLSAHGGAQGGDGGFVEISGQQGLLISGIIDLAAPSGTPGELLIDPRNIVVSNDADPTLPDGGTVVPPAVSTPGATFTASTGEDDEWLRIATAAITGFNGTVTLSADRDILVATAFTKAANQGGLTLDAGRNVTITAAVSVDGALTIAAGSGSIDIGANLRARSLTMTAGGDILQTGGNIRHRQGEATALAVSATTATGTISLAEFGNGAMDVTFNTAGAVILRSGRFGGGVNAVDGSLTIAGASSGGSVSLTSERANAASAGGTLTIDAALTSASGIILAADGALSQGADGAIVTSRDPAIGTLRIRNRNNDTAGPTSIALTAAQNQVAVLDAVTSGGLAFRAAGFAEGPGGTPAANPVLRIDRAQGAAVTVEAPRIAVPAGGTRVVAASGDVALIASEAVGAADPMPPTTLTVAGAVTAGDGAAVRLRADRMDLTGAGFDGTGAGSSLGVLEAGPQTAGRTVRIGGADDPATLWLGQTAPLTGADTGVLLLGETNIGAGTVTAGAVTVAANLAFGSTLTLAGTGAITQASGTAIAVPTLVLRGAGPGGGAGSVTLANTTNAIDALRGTAAGTLDVASGAATFTILAAEGSSVTLRGAEIALGDATVTATGANGRVTLLATGGIAQGAGGAIVAPELAAEARAGNIALAGSGNDIRSVADALTIAAGAGPLLPDAERGLYASGTVALTTQGALTLAGAVESRGGLVALTAGSLQIGAPVAVSGTATPRLTLVTDSSGGASGAIGSSAPVLTPVLAVAADGAVALDHTGNAVGSLAASVAAGAFSLTTAGPLAVTGDVTAGGRLALRTVGGPLAFDGTLTAPRIELRAGTTLVQGGGGALASAGGPTELLAQAGSGSIALNLAGDVRVVDGGVPGGAGLSAPGTVSLTSGGAIEVAAAVLGAGITLGGEAVAIGAPLTTPGVVSLTAAGADDASTITQTAAGVITASLLTASAAGAIDLSLAPNAVGMLGAFSFSDAFGYRSTTGFTVGAALAPADAGSANITIIADTGIIDLLAPIDAGTGTVRLEATTGHVDQANAGARITAGRLEVTAGGNARLAPALEAEWNQVGVLGPGTIGGVLVLNAAGSLTLDGVIAQAGSGGSAAIQTGGALTQNAGGVLAFDSIALSAPQTITLRGTIGVAQPTPVSTVRIGAGAGIAIEGAGRIVAQALGLRATGDVALDAGTNDIRSIAADVTGRFSMDTNGALATATVIGVPLPGASAATITGVTGTHTTLSAADLTINPGGLFGTGASATAADGVLTLHADRLTMNSQVFAGDPFGAPNLNGTIVIAPRTPGRTMVLGAVDPGALSLIDLTPFLARNLVFGRADAGAGTLRVAAGVAVSGLLDIDSVALHGGAIAIDSVFDMPSAGGLVSLVAASGDITQGAAGTVVASRLDATAANGSVRLDGAANQVGEISGGAGGDFAFRGAGNYLIATPGIAAPDGTVSLFAPSGSIGQVSGAPIAADRLAVAANGTVVLDGGGAGATPADLNRVGTLAPSSSVLTFTLRNADPLTVEDLTIQGVLGGQITLEAPSLTLAGTITALDGFFLAGRVVLRTGADFDAPAAGTSVTQTGGIIRTTNLSVSAGDSVDLRQANEIVQLAAGQSASGAASADSVVMRAGGDFALSRANGSLEVAARVDAGAGSAVRIASNGLTVAPGLAGTVFFAPGGVVRFQPFSAGGTIGLGGPAGFDTASYATGLLQRVQAERLVIGDASAGTITLRSALDLTGPSGPRTLDLRSGGDILAGGFNLALQEVTAAANGSIALGSAGSAIQRIVAGETAPEGLRAGGSIMVATGGTLAVDAPVVAGGPGIALQAADFVLAPGAIVRTGADPAAMIHIRSTAPGGFGLGVAGAASGLTPQEIALLDAQGGLLRLEGNAITLAGTVAVDAAAAGMLEFLAGGAVTQTGGTLSAEALRVQAGSIRIDRAGNALPVVQATATGDIAIASDGQMTVLGTRSLAGTVRLDAGGILLSGAAGTPAVQAAGAATLTAATGDITGLAGLAAVVAPVLNATAANGAITLTGDNGIGTLVAVAGTGVTVTNAAGLTASVTGPGGAALAGEVTLRAASLMLNDVLATGTVRLTATGAAIRQQAGGRLATGELFAEAPGGLGAILLDGSDNAVGGIGGLSATGDVTLRNAQALTIDVPLSVNDFRTLTLEAPTLTLDANLAAGAGGRIVLRTGAFEGGARSGGDIIQAGGTISTALLAALAGGSVSLDLPGNAIGALGGGVSASGADLGLGLSAGASAVVRNDAGTLGVPGAIDLASGGSLLLRADDLAIGAQIRVPNGTITLLPVGTGIGYVLGGAAGSVNAGRITLDSTELGFLPTGTPAAELVLGQAGVTGDVTIAGPVALATNGADVRVGRLTLAGDGSLMQNAGTFIDVAALRALFPNGAVLLDPGAAGNRIAALEGVVAGGDVAIRGGAGMMALRDGGSGAAITVTAEGRNVTLRADDLDIQAAVQAPGGVISILPETAGRTVTLGGAAGGTLALDTAEIARLGGAGAALDAPGAAWLRIGSDGAQRTAGDIVVAGDVPLRDGASVRVGTLELVAGQPGAAGGSVRQTGGSVDAAAVTGTAQGDFRLGLPGNAFGTASGITAGTLPAGGAPGVVEIATAGDLTATGIQTPASVRISAGAGLSAGGIGATDILLQGGTVSLSGLIQGSNSIAIDSLGAVTQEAGALIVTSLFTLNGGSVLLPEDNAFIELNGLVATGPVLALHTVLPLLVSGAVTADGTLSLTTDQGLTVNGAGSITVTGGPGSATLTAGGGIAYAGTLATAGAATLTAGGALAFTGTASVGGDAAFQGGGTLTLGGTVTAAGDVTGSAAGALNAPGQVTAGGDLRLAAGGLLTATNRLQAVTGALDLIGGTGLTATGLFLAGGDATLAALAGAATVGGTVSAGGDAALTGATTLQSTATVQAGQALALSAGAGMTLGGSHVAGTTLDATAGGAIIGTGTLRAGTEARLTAGQAMDLRGTVQAGTDMVLRAGTALAFAANGSAGGLADLAALGGDLVQSGTLSAGEAALAAAGALAQTGTVLGAGEVRLSAGGALLNTGTVAAGASLALAAGGDMAQTGLLQSGGTASLTAGGGLALSGQTFAGTDLTIAAGGQASLTSGKITAGNEASLTAGGVALQSFAIDAATILLRTGGDMTIVDSSLVSNEEIRLVAGSMLLRGSTFTTGALDVDAAGFLTLDGGLYVIGRAVAFSAPGGIATTRTITVRPRGGVLPAVVFDTRAAGARPDPLAVVQPDQPGLPANQQPTQVRMPNTEAPGAFGPASAAPAGPLHIDVDAGRSAIFLLIDGGNATGNIVSAGRLGIHGTGGSAELTGRFVDANGVIIGGGSAARFGDSTRPAASGTLTRYRINNCVISSINCIVPSQVLVIPQAPPQRVDINIGGGRITDPDVQMPNVAEEDY